MPARPSPIRLGIPEGKLSWPVRVTTLGVHVLAEGQESRVKIHFGRLGRFVRRADLPPFEGVETWFLMRIENGRYHVGEQVPEPEKKAVPLPKPATPPA